jgi:ATP-binding cassette subfamily B (MDR/TAP) protein 1
MIKSKTSTAIVGPSGSGKSTIVQMIERFYDPKSGDIHMDDINIKEIKISTLRESIGYVSQEPVLIMGTIRQNLAFGWCTASEEDMKEALRQANALDFVMKLDGGLDAYVGASSMLNLSGG